MYYCDAHAYFILTFFSIIALNLGNFGYVIIKLWILVENLNLQNARNIQIYNLLVKKVFFKIM